VSCEALRHAHAEWEFAGSDRAPGLLEGADRGTLLLEDVNELSVTLQRHVLRAMRTGEMQRIGAAESRRCDVRLIMTERVQDPTRHESRSTLVQQLAVARVVIPPLRNRPADLLPMARAFAAGARRDAGRAAVHLGGPAEELIASHSWPGNVRELRNVMEAVALLSVGDTLDVSHLSRFVPAMALRPALASELATLERARIIDALERCGGNQTQAAKFLGMSRRTFVARLGEYGLPRPLKGRQ
jgi:DNA-binding NtrC family response regulator